MKNDDSPAKGNLHFCWTFIIFSSFFLIFIIFHHFLINIAKMMGNDEKMMTPNDTKAMNKWLRTYRLISNLYRPENLLSLGF